jgi:metallo-beta-lactamase family protein
MLEDAAMIQKYDAEYINRSIERDHVDMDHVEPLYDKEDVVAVLDRMISIPYHRQIPIADGVKITFLDAGHVLGSAITILDIEDGSETKRLVFTGDLGRKRIPILRDPEVPPGAQTLITESTYGDRLHKPIEQMDDDFAAVVKRVYERGGKIVVPSFALERAQEIVYAIKRLKARNRFPNIPVYVDSPLTVKITDIFRLHPECYDAETRQLIEKEQTSPFEFDSLKYVSDKEASKAIDQDQEPCVVISASGMCEAGRVVHHLKATVEDAKNCVMIVGFQAPHTLGRRLVEKRARVKIFGVERDVRAEVVVMNGFSAHADQKDLTEFVHETKAPRVVLVHGEPQAQRKLREKLSSDGVEKVTMPAPGERMEI